MFEQGIKQVGLKYGPQNKFAVRIPPTVGKGAVSVACVHLSIRHIHSKGHAQIWKEDSPT